MTVSYVGDTCRKQFHRFYYHAEYRVLSQQIMTFMNRSTHADSAAKVVEDLPYTNEIHLIGKEE